MASIKRTEMDRLIERSRACVGQLDHALISKDALQELCHLATIGARCSAPTDSEVEQVAWAICASRGDDPERMTYQTIPGEYVQEPYGPAWLHFMDEARAAISAMVKA
jgi:hypothetical protein